MPSWRAVGFLLSGLIVVLLGFFYFLGPACSPRYRRDGQRTTTRTQGLGLHVETGPGGGEGGLEFDLNPSGVQSPRILTLLTTYHGRTAFARANREAMEQRADGYKSLMFVTSDEEDQDEDGAVDYKYGLADNHRLLGAITEAYGRHKGEFDWMAIGDDDTLFLYNRARAFLSHINHTQPVALGSVDGIHPEIGQARPNSTCFTPSEKNTAASSTVADKGCCRDFTHPCEVPAFPSTSERAQHRLRPTWLKTEENKDVFDPLRKWTVEYGKGGLFWPYGGSGMFLSAGLIKSVQQGSNGAGWQRCTDMFGIGYDTDLQLGMCLRAHGFSTSTYPEGFDRTCETADPDEIRDRLATNCQVLGIHLGIHHLSANTYYTPDAFKQAAVAVHEEDQMWTSRSDPYMAQCPRTFEAISMWK